MQNCEISENGVGVLIDTCLCNSILDNTFLHNGLAVQDVATSTANPSTSLVAGNQAFDNGTGSTGTCYDVWYAFGPAPTTSSDLTVGFPPLATVAGENSEFLGSCGLAPRAELAPKQAVTKATMMANLAKYKEEKMKTLFGK